MEKGLSKLPRLELVPMNDVSIQRRRALSMLRNWRSTEANSCGVYLGLLVLFGVFAGVAAFFAVFAVFAGELMMSLVLSIITLGTGRLATLCSNDLAGSIRRFLDCTPTPKLLAEAAEEAALENATARLNIRISKWNLMIEKAEENPNIDPRFFRFLCKEWEVLKEKRSKALLSLSSFAQDP